MPYMFSVQSLYNYIRSVVKLSLCGKRSELSGFSNIQSSKDAVNPALLLFTSKNSIYHGVLWFLLPSI